MEDLDEEKMSGWLASPEGAHQILKTGPLVVVIVRNGQENGPASDYYDGAGARTRPRLIVGHEAVLIVLV